MLKFAGIIVVASAAGITHSLINEPIKLTLAPMPAGTGTVVIPQKPVTTPDNDPAETDLIAPESQNGTTVVLQREITLDQARMLFENGLADFVDSRPKEDYEKGHILGAYNVAPTSFDIGTPPVIDFFEEDRRVVVYCTGGDCHDSHIVVQKMMETRPELVLLHVFTDGYPAWTEAGLPTDTGPDPLAE